MEQTAYYRERALQALLHVAHGLGGEVPYDTVFNVLYMAERKHLVEEARPIFDDYMKMERGPVPSFIHDLLRVADGSYAGALLPLGETAHVRQCLQACGGRVRAMAAPDCEYLNQYERACLNHAIDELKATASHVLTLVPHDEAWHLAQMHGRISSLSIAKAAGASKDALEMIEEEEHWEQFFQRASKAA